MQSIERILSVAFTAATLLGAGACESAPLDVPDADEVRSLYDYEGDFVAQVNGNVAEIHITQPADQIRRGGALWVKLGPYVVLFSAETRQLFESYPGLAGVRVVSELDDGTELARALLRRSELSGVLWRRSLNVSGRARRDGTSKLGLLSELVQWGERHTEFEYNRKYMDR